MEILMNCVVSVLQMLVFTVYLKELLGFRRPIYWMVCGWLGLELVSRGLAWIFNNVAVNALSFLLLLCMIAIIMCRGSWKKRIFVTITYVVIVDVIEAILVSVLMVLKVRDMDSLLSDPMLSGQILILNQMLVFICYRLFFLVGRRWLNLQANLQNWLGIFCVSVSCFVAMTILTLDMIIHDSFSVGKIIILCILIGLNFLSYYFYTVSAEKSRIATEAKVYQKQVQIYGEWYESIQQSRTELNAFRHDVNNHFHVLQELCRRGEVRSASQESLREINHYINGIGINYQKSLNDVDSGNMVIDSIIDAKKSYAASKGIVMTVKMLAPREMKSNELDMVILLGNLLDNAVEACEKIPEEGRFITLLVSYGMKNLVISVENSYDGHLDGRTSSQIEAFALATTKQNTVMHGIGTQNIRGIVDKYKGGISWKAKNQVFYVDIILYTLENGQNEPG